MRKTNQAAPAAAPAVPALSAEGAKASEASKREIARLSAASAKKAPRKLAKTGTKSAAKSAAVADDEDLIPLKSICRKLDIDPKRARVVLRRRLRSEDLPSSVHTIGEGRWNLTPPQAERVRTTLREFLREQA
jgi:hypothetical protein